MNKYGAIMTFDRWRYHAKNVEQTELKEWNSLRIAAQILTRLFEIYDVALWPKGDIENAS